MEILQATDIRLAVPEATFGLPRTQARHHRRRLERAPAAQYSVRRGNAHPPHRAHDDRHNCTPLRLR